MVYELEQHWFQLELEYQIWPYKSDVLGYAYRCIASYLNEIFLITRTISREIS